MKLSDGLHLVPALLPSELLLAATVCCTAVAAGLQRDEMLCQQVSQIHTDCKGAICCLNTFRNLKFYSKFPNVLQGANLISISLVLCCALVLLNDPFHHFLWFTTAFV